MEQVHGVENLIKSGNGLLEGFDRVSDARADGKIDLSEWFSITMGAVTLGPTLVKSYPEFLELSDQEAIEVKAAFKAKLQELEGDAEEDKYEQIAAKLLDHLVGLANVGNDIYTDLKKA